MTLLLANDDGIEAMGLNVLSTALDGVEDLLICAPLENRSGVGASLTLQRPVTVQPYPPRASGAQRYGVDGTPVDAVKFGLRQILKEPPSLVVTGVNQGANVGVNVLYSGTLGAAFEGVIAGVSAVAVSLEVSSVPHWDTAARYTTMAVRYALDLEARRRSGELDTPPFCLNVNVPDLPFPKVKGIRLTRQGASRYAEIFRPHCGGDPNAYTLDGTMTVVDADITHDARALQDGYVSITPLTIDFTHGPLLQELHRMPLPENERHEDRG